MGTLAAFRGSVYDCLFRRADVLFELGDALLCTDGPVDSLVGLSLAVEHRRGHGALHDGQHTRWSLGIPIPPQVTFVHPIAVVDTRAPKRWRALAYECARLARADGGYDLVSFPHPSNDYEPSDDDTRAYLFATRSHVIGYLSVDDSAFNRAWNFESVAEISWYWPFSDAGEALARIHDLRHPATTRPVASPTSCSAWRCCRRRHGRAQSA
jgi:hypothetical protein